MSCALLTTALSLWSLLLVIRVLRASLALIDVWSLWVITFHQHRWRFLDGWTTAFDIIAKTTNLLLKRSTINILSRLAVRLLLRTHEPLKHPPLFTKDDFDIIQFLRYIFLKSLYRLHYLIVCKLASVESEAAFLWRGRTQGYLLYW